ncbi:MAG: ATP-binding protein [Acidimicrobiales bacterium]
MMWRPRRRCREAIIRPAIRELSGHLVLTESSVWAHYELGGQRWSFLDDNARVALLGRLSARWAALAGRAIKLRVTSRPYPAAAWARAMNDATGSTRLPDVAGAVDYDHYLAACTAGERPPALSYNGWLAGQQARVMRSRLDERQVILGVRVAARPPRLRADTLVAGADPGLVWEIRALDEQMAAPGFDARPADAATMERLLHGAAALGVPTPSTADAIGGPRSDRDDLAAVIDPVRWTYEPWGRSVQVDAHRDGTIITRHVVVLTVGRMEDQRYPESGRAPWMTYADQLEFPSEWSLSGRIVGARDYEKEADFHRNRVLNIARHYRHDHGETPPLSVSRAIDHAEQIVDDVTEGSPEAAARFRGVIRLAVWGSTVEEAISRTRRVTEHYADEVRIAIEHPVAQARKLAEFFPAEPWESVGYQRVLPVGYLAAGLPHTSAAIGDGAGPYLGYACGTTRFALMLDACAVTEGPAGRSGLCPVVADPGGGKSFLTGVLAYHGARRGTQTIVLDPSGPLAALCDLPELAPYAQRLSLSAGAPGTLSPCGLIPDPVRSDHDSEDDYRAEMAVVAQDRRETLIEALIGLLPYEYRGSGARWLPRVVRTLAVSPETTPWAVIDALTAAGSEPAELADQLRDAAALRDGALILGEPGRPTTPVDTAAALTVITIEGVQLPAEGTSPADYSLRERIAQPVLALAILYASRFVYSGPANRRRQLHLDEVHFLARWSSGRSFFQRLARDSRKRNTAVFASSQVPADVLSLGVGALFAHAFVGRLQDEETTVEALRLVRTPEVYASTIAGLSQRWPGEFLYLDPVGRVQRVRIDAAWLPHLTEALRTDPGSRPAQRVA